MTEISGSPARDRTRDPRDLGVFGPGSVTWRVHGDPMAAVAEVRAVLLRLLHPEAVRQTRHLRHSGTWNEAVRAAEYVMTTSFGTTHDANEAAARAAALWRAIPGIDTPGIDAGATPTEEGTGTANEGTLDLLRWVHCCNVDSYLQVTRRSGLRLSDLEADAYVAEQVRTAALLGIPADEVPSSQAALALYFERMRPQLRVTPEARAAAASILWPRMRRWIALATPARPMWIGLSVLSFLLLPAWGRRMYGFRGLGPMEPLAGVVACALRRSLRAVPRRVRESEQVAQAKQRVAATPVMRLDALRTQTFRPATGR